MQNRGKPRMFWKRDSSNHLRIYGLIWANHHKSSFRKMIYRAIDSPVLPILLVSIQIWWLPFYWDITPGEKPSLRKPSIAGLGRKPSGKFREKRKGSLSVKEANETCGNRKIIFFRWRNHGGIPRTDMESSATWTSWPPIWRGRTQTYRIICCTKACPFWGSIMKRPYIVNPKRFGPINIWHILAFSFQLDWRYSIKFSVKHLPLNPLKIQIDWPCLLPNIGRCHHQKTSPCHFFGCLLISRYHETWTASFRSELSPWWRSECYAQFPHWPSNQRCDIRELNGGWKSWEKLGKSSIICHYLT